MKLHIRLFNGPSDWPTIYDKLKLKRVEDMCGFVAEDETGKLHGAVMFDNFLNSSVQASIWLENSFVLRHGLLEEAFDFVYYGLNKTYIYTLIHEKNIRSLRLSKRLGFKEKMRIPDGYKDGIDYIVQELSSHESLYYEREVG